MLHNEPVLIRLAPAAVLSGTSGPSPATAGGFASPGAVPQAERTI